MARSGPVPISVEIQKAGAGAFLTLDDITEISGALITVEKVDTTAFTDPVNTMGPTGVRTVDDLVLKGFYDPAPDTAFTRIGAPATAPSTTPDNIRINYTGSTSRTFAMLCDRRDPMPSLGAQTMFEAGFYQAGVALVEDYTP